MAIVRKSASIAETASGTSLSIARPSGLADGDVLWAALCIGSNGAELTIPNGFTEFASANQGNVVVIYGYVKVIEDADSEPEEYEFSGWPATRATGFLVAYSGVDNTTPIDVTASSATANSGTTLTVPSITTVTDGAMLIGLAGQDSASGDITEPVSMDQILESTGTGKCSSIADEEFDTAGATGTRQWSFNASLAHAAYLGALRPATGGQQVEGTAVADLGALVAAATGQRIVSGTAASALGALTATSTGIRIVSGAATAALGALTATGIGFYRTYGVAVANLGGLSAHASGKFKLSEPIYEYITFGDTEAAIVDILTNHTPELDLADGRPRISTNFIGYEYGMRWITVSQEGGFVRWPNINRPRIDIQVLAERRSVAHDIADICLASIRRWMGRYRGYGLVLTDAIVELGLTRVPDRRQEADRYIFALRLTTRPDDSIPHT